MGWQMYPYMASTGAKGKADSTLNTSQSPKSVRRRLFSGAVRLLSVLARGKLDQVD